MTKEETILDIMHDLDCTREDAEVVYQLEEKAKTTKADKVVASSGNKRKSTKVDKTDPDKEYLVNFLNKCLMQERIATNIVNPTREINFTFKDDNYSLIISRHRQKKA